VGLSGESLGSRCGEGLAGISSVIGAGGGRSSPAGITIAIKGRQHEDNNEVIDKLRMRDGRSKEMDMIFRAQDRQMEAMGRTILEDRLELRRSSNITSSDELRAEKAGTVGLSGSEKYNPATGRRTRLSF
jgi:hypothetical protein